MKPPGARRMRCRRLTTGSSTTPVVPESERPSRACGFSGPRPRPRKRARSVSHSTGTLGPAFEAQDVNRPGAGLVRGARPPVAQQGGAFRKVLRLHEQLAERGVGQVVGGGGEDDLGVARDLDLARAIAMVGHREPPHLDVVFGRYRDVELGRDVVVAPVERRLLREEGDQVVLRLLPGGLEGGRPDGAAAHVAQVEELAPRVAGGIFTVPGYRTASTEAGAPSGVRHHGGVVAVGQELRVGEAGVGRPEAPDRERGHGRRRPASPPPAGAG